GLFCLPNHVARVAGKAAQELLWVWGQVLFKGDVQVLNPKRGVEARPTLAQFQVLNFFRGGDLARGIAERLLGGIIPGTYPPVDREGSGNERAALDEILDQK